jgi:hypothetical protein
LFLAEHQRELAKLELQIGDGGIAVAQTRIEFAFAQRQHVGAYVEGLLLVDGRALLGLELEPGAAAAFLESLHPESFGDVGHGFGEAVQGGGPGVQARGEPLPPGI